MHTDVFFQFWKTRPLGNIIFEKLKNINTSLKCTNSNKFFNVTSRSHNYFPIWDFFQSSNWKWKFWNKKKYVCKISKLIWALWEPWEQCCQRCAMNQGLRDENFQTHILPRDFAQTWSRQLFLSLETDIRSILGVLAVFRGSIRISPFFSYSSVWGKIMIVLWAVILIPKVI